MAELVNGRYRIKSHLGSGGMGTILLAEDLAHDGAPVALKLVDADSGESAAGAEALIHEFEILARLRHPNLPVVHDFGRSEDGSRLFISMEYVEGRSLTEEAPHLEAGEALDVVAQTCRALEFIHTRGLVHRDVKPENVLVTRPDTGKARAVLVDFGLASAARDPARLHGTLHYVAPEVLRGERADRRADLYALGVLLYRLSTGRCPFEGTPQEVLKGHTEIVPAPPAQALVPGAAAPLRPILNEALSAAILRLLEKDPARRYRSAAETLQALNRATGSKHPIETAETGGSYSLGASLSGRERQIEQIDALLERLPARAASGHADRDAPVALVAGEAGCGKTRFVLEAKRRAQVRGILAASVACSAEMPAFQPIHEAISLLGGRPIEPSVAESGEGPAERARLRAVDAAAVSLAERAASSPAVLLVDDAHLADEGTLSVCEVLVRNAAATPGLLVVLAYRPEEVEESRLQGVLERLRRLARVEEIALPPLSAEETGALLAEMLGMETVPAGLVDLVVRETSGNPFFVEQAVRSLLEDGTISRLDLTFRADVDALTRIAFPAGAGEAVGRRLARLSAEQRWVLESIAAVGRPADRGLLRRVTEMSDALLGAALDALVERRLVAVEPTGTGAAYGIANARTRDFVYEGTSWERRRSLHAAIAAELRARRDGGEPIRLEELARHFIHGSELAEALPWALDAAERCRLIGAASDARAFYRQALDLLPPAADAERSEILRKAGTVERELGRDAQALESFEQSLRSAGAAQRRDLAARARLEKADVYLRRGRSEDVVREVERILELLSDGSHRALSARAHSFMASALARGGRLDRAMEVQQRALEAAQEAGEPAAVAAALNNLGLLAWIAGRPEEAVATLERSIQIRREIGDRNGEMEATSNVGLFLAGIGDHARARPRLETCVALARALGDLRALVEAQINLAQARVAEGAHDAAVPSLEEAAAVALRIGDEIRASYALDVWGASLRAFGDLEGALARHGEALERARRAADPAQELYALASLALDHATAGHLEDAREMLRRAGRRGNVRVPPRARARLQEATALTNLLAGGAREAAAAADEMLEVTRAERLPAEEARARHLKGLALMASGEVKAAEAELAGAIALAESSHADELLWRIHAAAADQAAGRGDAAASRSAAARAVEILDRLAARIGDEEMRARWLAVPERSKVRERAEPAAGSPARGGRTALAALYRISEAITASGDLDDLLGRVLDVALEIVRAERGLIILVDEDGVRQEVRAARGCEPETITDALEYSHSVVKESASGRTVVTIDAESDRDFRRYRSVSLFNIKSLACVPMRIGDRIIGTVYLDSRVAGYLFRDEDVEFLRAFANLAGAAIELSRLNARIAGENVVLQREVQDLRKAAGRRSRYQELIGRTPRMQAIYDVLERVSASNLPVLITGESGTGKELVARALHFGGSRKERKFFSENVAAIPETLLESELFGHTRGSFTGADRDRKGAFELANHGTLFLDEIGDMPLVLQSKLLRALQEGEVRPIGARDAVRVDVRVISATNRDLDAMLAQGRFREDLYYRLNVIRINLPPLRERKEDIPLLVEHFLTRAAETAGVPRKRLDISALQLLLRYDWPGNIRELENELMKLVVLSSGDVIAQSDLAANRDLMDRLTRLDARADAFPQLQDVERRQIERALTEAGGNRARAAQLLGISRATIYRKLKEYHLGG